MAWPKAIDNWLGENMLKNNGDKLEAIIFGTWQQRAKLEFDSIELLDNPVSISQKVKNLGIIFDADMSMSSQISQMAKCSRYHLRNISQVRRYLPEHAVRAAVHASVTSRLDTGGDRMFAHIGPALWNSLPFGIRESQTLAQYSRQLKTHLYRKAYL